MKTLSVLLAGIAVSVAMAAPPVQHPSSGRIDRHYIYSPQMGDTVTVDVWVPECYLTDCEVRLPVIYMHDGQNLFDASTTWNHQAWEADSVAAGLVARGRISPVMIVGVHSTQATRTADLMPQRLFEDPQLMDVARGILTSPLRGDAYAAFVSTTLRDSVNTAYRTLTDAPHTAVMGSSMGGLMSLYMLCEYPEVYGQAGCLSTHWIGDVEGYRGGDERFPEAMYEYVRRHLPRDGAHRIYMDRGTETLDANYGKWDERVKALIGASGYDGTRFDSYVDEGGAHDEASWMRRLWRPLEFLFPAGPRD